MKGPFRVRLLASDGSESASQIELLRQTEPGQLRFTRPGADPVTTEGPDMFEAFLTLRRELEQSGFRLVCAGARRDAWPSGMSRSMGGGRAVYLTVMGEPCRTPPVDLFDDADPGQVGSVDEQVRFHQDWVESLRRAAGH